MLLNSKRHWTVAVALEQFWDSAEAPWNYMMPLPIIYSLPAGGALLRPDPPRRAASEQLQAVTGIGRRRSRRTSAFGLNVGKIVVLAPASRHESGHICHSRVQRRLGTSASPKCSTLHDRLCSAPPTPTIVPSSLGMRSALPPYRSSR